MKIGITGGKGGTGKSTVATALAFELAKNNTVLLVDADVDCPNDHLILAIKRNKVKDIKQVIPKFDFSKCKKCGKCGEVCKYNAVAAVKGNFPIFIESICNGCHACIIACPNNAIKKSEKIVGEIFEGSYKNIDLISAQIKPRYFGSAFVVGKEKEYAKNKEKDYDYVITDTAAGTHCNVLEALSDCEVVIAVTEPTPLGEHDLDLILKLLKILKKESKIVVNRSDIGDKNLIRNLVKKYKAKIIAEIPYSKRFIELYSEGKPMQNKNISKIIEEIKK